MCGAVWQCRRYTNISERGLFDRVPGSIDFDLYQAIMTDMCFQMILFES